MELLGELTGPYITGGAWGTELQARGLPAGASADAWNVTRPNVIEEIAAAYAQAGSSIVLTNTFQANRIALDRHGLASEVGRINRLGVVHARRGVDHSALVFGAIGPTGEAPEIEREAAYREQAEALAEANAYGIVVETMTTLPEARTALSSALTTGLPVVVSLTAGLGPAPDRLLSGEAVVEAMDELLEAGASRVGLNCMDARQMLPLCEAASRTLGVPLWMKPNGGQPIIFDGVPRYGLDSAGFADHAAALVEAGAAFIGGCCGIGPEHIQALAAALSPEKYD